MTPLELQSLAQLLTARMLNSAAAGVLLTALVWAALRLIRRQNSGTRFAVWSLALVAVVSLPFFAGAGASAAEPALHPLPALHTAVVLSGSWALYLFAAWAAGATLLLARLAAGLWRLARLRARCTEADAASLAPETIAILSRQSPGRPVKLCLSTEVATPAVVGFFRPAIVFPAWLLPQLSPAELEIILLHELAHLRRHDQWSNLLQKTFKALFFFHPAVWWIESQLTLEREMACDDMVLAHRASPRTYASVLITLAEKLHSAPAMALAQALVSRMRQMSLRVSQIMDRGRPTGTALRKPVFSAGAALLALAVATAPYMPKFVAFRTPAASHPAQNAQAATRVSSAVVPAAAPGPHSAAAESAESSSQELRPEETKPTLAALRDETTLTLPHPAAMADDSETPVFNTNESQSGAVPASAKVATDFHASNAAAADTAELAPHGQASAVSDMIPQPAFAPPATIVIVETTLVRDANTGEWIVRIWTVEGDHHAEQQPEALIALEI